MRSILAIAVLLLSSSFAAAECNVVATNEKGASVYQCEPPAQAPSPVQCRNLYGVLLCTGEIGQEVRSERGWTVVKPVNCAWRKGRYVCW